MSQPVFDPASSTVADAQRDMRMAYAAGAPGMLSSALVWFVAAAVAYRVGPERAIWALFIGGMLIHPISLVLCKLIGRSGKHSAGNPLAALAMATTFWMILSLPLAFGASLVRLEWFFPAMLLIIGGRYLTFSTIYGLRIYWLCGAALAAAGWMLARSGLAPEIGAASGGMIEVVFAGILFYTNQGREQNVPTAASIRP